MRSYIFQGLKREVAFQISGITKHQFYYQKKKTKQGRGCSIITFYTDCYGEKFEISNDIEIEIENKSSKLDIVKSIFSKIKMPNVSFL